jgi:homoserine acetyltransferase
MQTMCARLPRAQLHELSSLYGHDTFLKGPADLGNLVTQTLEVNT